MRGAFLHFIISGSFFLLLSGCINIPDEYAMPPDVITKAEVTYHHIEYPLDLSDRVWRGELRRWLTEQEIDLNDELLLISASHLTAGADIAEIWSDYSKRPLRTAAAPRATDVMTTLRLYRAKIQNMSCHDASGRYRLGCAVKMNRMSDLQTFSPIRKPLKQARPALYETVPEERVIQFQKPGWLKTERDEK